MTASEFVRYYALVSERQEGETRFPPMEIFAVVDISSLELKFATLLKPSNFNSREGGQFLLQRNNSKIGAEGQNRTVHACVFSAALYH